MIRLADAAHDGEGDAVSFLDTEAFVAGSFNDMEEDVLPLLQQQHHLHCLLLHLNMYLPSFSATPVATSRQIHPLRLYHPYPSLTIQLMRFIGDDGAPVPDPED